LFDDLLREEPVVLVDGRRDSAMLRSNASPILKNDDPGLSGVELDSGDEMGAGSGLDSLKSLMLASLAAGTMDSCD
jgi:hypothetical protein